MNETNVSGSFTAAGGSGWGCGALTSAGWRMTRRSPIFGLGPPAPGGVTASFVATLMAFVTSRLARSASRTAWRLVGPRTGVRGEKIQPIPGTGVAPSRRPRSNSHGCSPWNSWNESFDKTVASTFSATLQEKGVPAPDGACRRVYVFAGQGRRLETIELAGVDPVRERGVHDHGDLRPRMLTTQLGHGLFQLFEAGHRAALGGDVGSVDDDVLRSHVQPSQAVQEGAESESPCRKVLPWRQPRGNRTQRMAATRPRSETRIRASGPSSSTSVACFPRARSRRSRGTRRRTGCRRVSFGV